jgi:SPP1 family predicted phage head-tail adaptor
MINAGDFNERIDIVRHTPIVDADGFKTVQTTKIVSAWAKVSTVAGITLITNNTNFENATTRFLIRKPNIEIKRKDVVQFHGLDWQIRYLNDINEAGKFVELQCEQANNDNRATGGEDGEV